MSDECTGRRGRRVRRERAKSIMLGGDGWLGASYLKRAMATMMKDGGTGSARSLQVHYRPGNGARKQTTTTAPLTTTAPTSLSLSFSLSPALLLALALAPLPVAISFILVTNF